MAKWQQRYRADWDATDGVILLKMERSTGKAKEEDKRAVALVLDLAKAFERVSLPVVWAGRRTSASQGRSCECCAGTLKHQRRVQFEGCVAEPLQTITAILPGSKWSCLLLRSVLQDVQSEATKSNLPFLKLRSS